MKLNVSIRIMVSLICMMPCISSAGDDVQLWSRISFSSSPTEKVKLSLDEEFRVGEDIQKLCLHRSNLSLSHNTTPWFHLSIDYWYSTQLKGARRIHEHRPHLNATFKTQLQPFTIHFAHRLEWRMVENADKSWRYRARLKMIFPIRDSRFQPYVADDLFVRLKDTDVDLHRIYIGSKIRLTELVSLDCYYLFNMKNRETWVNDHVIGTAFGVG